MNELDQHLTLALNGSDSIFWNNFIYTITNTAAWTLLIITLLVIVYKNNSLRDAFIVYLMVALLVLVSDRFSSGFVKPLVERWRPTQDPYIMYLVDTVHDYRGGRYGFFSSHASNTMCLATFFALLFRHRFLSITLMVWALTTTFTRLYLGVHYLGDVVVGLVFGAALGVLFYYLMQKLKSLSKKENKPISTYFTPTGYLTADMDFLLFVIFGNYILLVIYSMTLSF